MPVGGRCRAPGAADNRGSSTNTTACPGGGSPFRRGRPEEEAAMTVDPRPAGPRPGKAPAAGVHLTRRTALGLAGSALAAPFILRSGLVHAAAPMLGP